MARVVIETLTKAYGHATAVDSLDLVVAEGEFVALLGPSGCGKTTTLRCVAGLDRPTRGRISIGQDVVDDPARHQHVSPAKRQIGMVFQSYALWPHMTVAANVSYPLRMRHVRRAEIGPKVAAALEMVGLAGYAGRPATALSGGQQQRVALARALVGEPRLLLFDEPLSNLDARLRTAMRDELRATHQRVGTTSIYVTHDQDEAVTLADRVVVMSGGRIQQVGTPREVYWQPVSKMVADFVGFDNFLSGKAIARRDGQLRVAIEGGTQLWCADHADVAIGGGVQVAIRSTAVLFGAEPAKPAGAQPGLPKPNVITGQITDRMYLGDSVEYLIDLGASQLKVLARVADLAAHWPAQQQPQPGDQLTVVIPQRSIACLPVPAAAAPVPAEPSTHESKETESVRS